MLALSAMALLLLTAHGSGEDLMLSTGKNQDLVSLLDDMEMIAELGRDPRAESAYMVRLIRVQEPGECDGTPESCPVQHLYVAVSEFGEMPDQNLYQLPEAHGWDFDTMVEMPKSASDDTFATFHMKREVVRERFALSRSYWLWEKLKDSVARRRDDGCSKATDYVGEKHAIFFLNESDGKRMWEFGSGQDLGRVLEASPPMEFYLTDADVTYVLCLNHHDVLIGTGACKAWLSSERTHQ